MEQEFRFFSWNKKTDWENGTTHNLSVTDAGMSLNQVYRYAMSRIVRFQEREEISEITDMAVDSGSHLALLNDRSDLLLYDLENDLSETLFRSGHGLFTSRAKLDVSGDLVFVADPASDNRTAAYSASNGQTIWSIRQHGGLEWFPLAISAGPRQTASVLVPLQVREGENGQIEVPEDASLAIVRISRNGQPVRVTEHELLRIREPRPLSRLLGRYHLTYTPSGGVAVLDGETGTVCRFSAEGRLDLAFSVLVAGRPVGLAADSRDNLYVGESRSGLNGENRRFLLIYDGRGRFLESLSGSRSRVDKLSVDTRDRLFIQSGTEEVLVYERKPRTLAHPETGLLEGEFRTEVIDSKSAETVWHKFELDADIPEETQIRVSYFASEHDILLHDGDPGTPAALSRHWSEPVVNPKDALFFRAKGRYLWLRLEFQGSEHASPFLRKMRVYYPRTSFLSYLPAIYQEENEGSDFLERFLSLFGTFYQQLEEQIGGISRYFDVDAVSGPFLKWLANWIGLAVDARWDDERVRNLLKRSPHLFRAWGTRQGIEDMIEICTGEKPYVIEHFQVKNLAKDSRLRKLFFRLYGSNPYSFCIIIKPEYVQDESQRRLIEKIVQEQKPAFTEAKIVVLQPWMFMDMHTYLGLNTYLSEPSLMKLDDQSSMPHHTVIIDVDRDHRMGIHTRLELDSELE